MGGFAVGFASFKRSGNLKTAASAVQTVVKSLRATRTESWKIAASVAGRLLASNKVNEPSDCAKFVADLVLKELGSAATINLAADAATDAAAFSGNATIEEVEQAAADAAKAAGAQDQPAVVLSVVKRAAVTAREFGCKTTNRKHLQPPNRDAEGKNDASKHAPDTSDPGTVAAAAQYYVEVHEANRKLKPLPALIQKALKATHVAQKDGDQALATEWLNKAMALQKEKADLEGLIKANTNKAQDMLSSYSTPEDRELLEKTAIAIADAFAHMDAARDAETAVEDVKRDMREDLHNHDDKAISEDAAKLIEYRRIAAMETDAAKSGEATTGKLVGPEFAELVMQMQENAQAREEGIQQEGIAAQKTAEVARLKKELEEAIRLNTSVDTMDPSQSLEVRNKLLAQMQTRTAQIASLATKVTIAERERQYALFQVKLAKARMQINPPGNDWGTLGRCPTISVKVRSFVAMPRKRLILALYDPRLLLISMQWVPVLTAPRCWPVLKVHSCALLWSMSFHRQMRQSLSSSPM